MPNILNLDNTIVASSAYRLVPKPELIIHHIKSPPNWLQSLGIALNCGPELNNHVGINSTYSGRKALLDGLNIIYIYYHGLNNHPIKPDEQAAIREKILEGVTLCTPGFHNRINQVVMGFQIPKSIDALMMLYRSEIVSKLANAHVSDVHEHNEYSLIANQMGKNVYAANDNDPHHLIEDRQTVRQRINTAFSRDYHPWAIILNVVAGYKNILMSHHDYTGFKARGYDQGDFDEWKNYLAQLLNLHEGTIDYNDFLIIDEKTCAVTDINWPYVTKTIAEELLNMNCFDLSAPQRSSLLTLTQVKENQLNFNINAALDLIPNDAIFLNILTLIVSVNAPLSVNLYNAYIQRHYLNNIEQQSLNSAIFKTAALEPLLHELVASQPKTFISELVRDDGINNGLQRALIQNNKTLVQCYMQILPLLYPHQRNTIFCNQGPNENNALMHASQKATWALKDLLDGLAKYPWVLAEALSRTNQEGENALALALKNNDPRSVKLLLNEMSQLETSLYRDILSNINPASIRRYPKTGCIVQAAQLLQALDDKTNQLQENHTEASNAAQKLYRNLSEHYQCYLSSDETPEAREQFALSWKDEIQQAKHSPLVHHRAYKEIAAILLLCLSVVGLFVIAAKAVVHYAKEGNMHFFNVTKTKTETCLDALDSVAVKVAEMGA